jgi:uncharacterized protein (DUF1800 family)
VRVLVRVPASRSARAWCSFTLSNKADTRPSVGSETMPHMSAPAIAINRFGLGARTDESIPQVPQRWLLAQMERYEAVPTPWQRAARTPALVDAWLAQQRAVRQAPEGQRSGIREAYLREGRDAYVTAVGARTASALQSPTPFVERLVHFWSNHFAVSVDKLLIVGLAGGFEADAIRPHVMGRFEDLLLAAVSHPAMLLYLDQAQSIGPRSLVGTRAAMRSSDSPQRPRGPQREPGARDPRTAHAGRAQRLHAGRRDRVRAGADGLDPAVRRHGDALSTPRSASSRRCTSPGPRTVMGRSAIPMRGSQQARAIIRDLVAAPATARHIARKLARHFVADDPPAALVQRLADRFERSDGDLPSVYRELIASPEAWAAPSRQVQVAVGVGHLGPARHW